MKNVIYHHSNTKIKQNKQYSHIYCINAYITNTGRSKYLNTLKNLVQESKNENLLNDKNKQIFEKSTIRDQLKIQKSGNSIFWDFHFINDDEKRHHDSFLLSSGYKKKLDKYGFYIEGCNSDDKIFLGGRKEMILFYCKKFRNSNFCKNLIDKVERNRFDNNLNCIFDDPRVFDLIADKLSNNLQ